MAYIPQFCLSSYFHFSSMKVFLLTFLCTMIFQVEVLKLKESPLSRWFMLHCLVGRRISQYFSQPFLPRAAAIHLGHQARQGAMGAQVRRPVRLLAGRGRSSDPSVRGLGGKPSQGSQLKGCPTPSGGRGQQNRVAAKGILFSVKVRWF